MSVFIKRTEKKFGTFPVGYKMRQKEGTCGIEIELEGNFFRKGPDYGNSDKAQKSLPRPWTYHNDGSLRGEDNAEYVTDGPIPFSEVAEHVTTLWKMLEEDGTVLDESNRTSVHVHLNVQKFHLNRLCSLLVLYFSVEELLTAWCGEHRVGNLFCLRAKDATGIITKLKDYFRDGGDYKFSDGMHYCGLNPQAIHKLGSVEIRTLRGATDPSLVIEWVSILERLYELSKEYPNPQSIIDMFSQTGPIGYLDFVLGPHVPSVLQGSGYTTERANNAMYEGIRLVQELCYCVPWEEYEAVEVKTDPFQRVVGGTSGQIVGSIGGYAEGPSDVAQWFSTNSIPYPAISTQGNTATSPTQSYSFEELAEMGEAYAANNLSNSMFEKWLQVQNDLNHMDDDYD